MPLVFIHGVNVREGETYTREVWQRNKYFANIFFKLLGREPKSDAFFSPYWGDLGTNLTPGNLFVPHHEVEMAIKRLRSLAGVTAGNALSLTKLIKRRPITEVLDAWLAAAMEFDSPESKEEAEEMSKLAFRILKFGKRFRSFDEQLEWMKGVQNDQQLLQLMEEELTYHEHEPDKRPAMKLALHRLRDKTVRLKDRYAEARGFIKDDLIKVRSQLRSGVQRLRTRTANDVKHIAEKGRYTATNMSASTITHPMRMLFHHRMFYFIGDAFRYFGHRGTPEAPGPIIQRVTEAISHARNHIDPIHDPELIVVAHSMGGNIICDLASNYDLGGPIDLLITVGAQFPLFADLGMFPGLPNARPIPRPPAIKRWINIYDNNDVFAFAAAPLFEGIEDVHYASGRFGVATHADCFKFVSLYEKLAEVVNRPVLIAK